MQKVRPSILFALAATLTVAAGSASAALPAGVDTGFETLMTDFGLLTAAAGTAIVGIPMGLKIYSVFKRVLAKV